MIAILMAINEYMLALLGILRAHRVGELDMFDGNVERRDPRNIDDFFSVRL